MFPPGLLHLMTDSGNPRVQAHSGAALVNFSEDCPKNILLPYLPDIMTRLKEVLEAKFNELVAKGNKLVLEQIVTTIASVADTAEEKFVEHYDKFMPCLKYMIGAIFDLTPFITCSKPQEMQTHRSCGC